MNIIIFVEDIMYNWKKMGCCIRATVWRKATHLASCLFDIKAV